MAGITIKLTRDKLTGEKEASFNSCAQSPHRNGPQRWRKQAASIYFRQ